MTMEANLSTIPLSGSIFATSTVSGEVEVGMRSIGSTTISELSPLQLYFRFGTPDALDKLLEAPPSVSEVIHHVLKEPGLETHDLAVELLGRLSARTLHFALQALPFNDQYLRPVYSNRVWVIVISALGMANESYADFIEVYMRRLLDDPNPVKRLAAFDALETLRD
jgi:hypothetical protein